MDEELKQALIHLQVSAYVNTFCANCRKEFTTVESTKEAVWWGSKKYPICCSKECFEEICPESLKQK